MSQIKRILVVLCILSILLSVYSFRMADELRNYYEASIYEAQAIIDNYYDSFLRANSLLAQPDAVIHANLELSRNINFRFNNYLSNLSKPQIDGVSSIYNYIDELYIEWKNALENSDKDKYEQIRVEMSNIVYKFRDLRMEIKTERIYSFPILGEILMRKEVSKCLYSIVSK